MGKQNLYDHSIRVPLIYAGPNIPRGKQLDALVYQSGLFPTACDLCGLPIPPTIEHRSMASLIRTGKGESYPSIYGGYREFQRMIRDHEWKLIIYPKAGVTQLFDMRRDPWETTNLAPDPKHALLITDLKNKLKAMQKDLDDTVAID
jgi:choline-sulfatase